MCHCSSSVRRFWDSQEKKNSRKHIAKNTSFENHVSRMVQVKSPITLWGNSTCVHSSGVYMYDSPIHWNFKCNTCILFLAEKQKKLAKRGEDRNKYRLCYNAGAGSGVRDGPNLLWSFSYWAECVLCILSWQPVVIWLLIGWCVYVWKDKSYKALFITSN